jgi:hypothetical protein
MAPMTYTDEGYDALCDELALIDPWDRDYRRPSDFPSSSAFVRAMSPTVAGPLSPAARHETGGAGISSPALVAVAPDLRRSGGGHRPSA